MASDSQFREKRDELESILTSIDSATGAKEEYLMALERVWEDMREVTGTLDETVTKVSSLVTLLRSVSVKDPRVLELLARRPAVLTQEGMVLLVLRDGPLARAELDQRLVRAGFKTAGDFQNNVKGTLTRLADKGKIMFDREARTWQLVE